MVPRGGILMMLAILFYSTSQVFHSFNILRPSRWITTNRQSFQVFSDNCDSVSCPGDILKCRLCASFPESHAAHLQKGTQWVKIIIFCCRRMCNWEHPYEICWLLRDLTGTCRSVCVIVFLCACLWTEKNVRGLKNTDCISLRSLSPSHNVADWHLHPPVENN